MNMYSIQYLQFVVTIFVTKLNVELNILIRLNIHNQNF